MNYHRGFSSALPVCYGIYIASHLPATAFCFPTAEHTAIIMKALFLVLLFAACSLVYSAPQESGKLLY
jgi:hypothetical protein